MKFLNNVIFSLFAELKCVYISVILFFFVFNPYLFNANGAIFVAFILSLVFLSQGTVNVFLFLLKRKENLQLLLLFACSYVYATYSTVYFEEYDFSKLQKLVKFPYIYISAMWYSSIVIYHAERSVQTYLNIIVMLQLFIVLCCIVSPEFTTLVRSINDPVAFEKLSDYGDYRGVSWAANAFFGLAVILSFIILNWLVESYENGKRSFLRYIFLFLSLIILTVTARTTFLAIGFFLLYLVFKNTYKSKLFLLKILFVFVLFLNVLIFLIYVTSPDIIEFLLSAMNRSFEFVNNYIMYGSFSSGSTEILQSMYFPIDVNTLIFGDARYMDGTHYYMYTDAGYMRNVLYWGLVGMLPNFIFALLINYRVYDGLTYKFLFFSLFIFTLHIKGEVVSHENMLYSAIFLMYFYSIYNREFINRARRVSH